MSDRRPDVDPGALDQLLEQVFGTSTPLSWKRAAEGVSTQVYRVQRAAETFYLRVAEEAGDDLRTDAELHRRLRLLGVRVAEVVHVDQHAPSLDRSIMVTTEVAGICLSECTSPQEATSVIEEAGRDLARINQVAVEGFGFVRRNGAGWPLEGEYRDHATYLTSYLPDPWPGPLATIFSEASLQRLHALLQQERDHPPVRAVLAHGDFDVTQVFYHRNPHGTAAYSGLIDFGEMRGAEPMFDLGHFHLYDEETSPSVLLPALLRGYRDVTALPEDHDLRLRRSAVLLGLRQLCRWLGPPRHRATHHPAVVHRARRIEQLLAAL